jgi:hypothetical protein
VKSPQPPEGLQLTFLFAWPVRAMNGRGFGQFLQFLRCPRFRFNTVEAIFETIAARDCFLIELRGVLRCMFVHYQIQVDPSKDNMMLAFRPRWRGAPIYTTVVTLVVRK